MIETVEVWCELFMLFRAVCVNFSCNEIYHDNYVKLAQPDDSSYARAHV